jgi:hypothetical protein
VLIVAGVLALLHGFWLFSRLTNQHVDVLAYWLPRWCYLGKSLAHGTIPTWLPYQAGGVPFASDPQSGWLSLPPMLLFSTLSCTRAMAFTIVVQPLIAGLAIYQFFRKEGLGRPAAAVGGLTLALSICGSVAVLSMPFAGTLAWTAVALWGAAGYLRAPYPSSRVAWVGLSVFGLGQVAAAHPTNGLFMGLTVLFVYVLTRCIAQVQAGMRSIRSAIGSGLALFVAFVPLSAAILIPRLALAPRTALVRGYRELDQIAAELSGHPAPSALAVHGFSPWWGTSFARGPGGYVGAAAILLIPVALSSRRWRLPAAGFAAIGALAWASNLDWLVRARLVRQAVLSTRLGELWLRDPSRFQFLLMLSFAALGGYGYQAWLDAKRSGLRPVLWFAPSVVVFALWPILWGSSASRYVLFAAGTVVLVPLLLLAARGTRWAALLIPALVAMDLTVAGLVGQAGPVHQLQPVLRSVASQPPGSHRPANEFGTILGRLERPAIDGARYTTPGPIGRALIANASLHERYLTLDPQLATEPRGFLLHQDPASWPAYEDGRSILFGIDQVQGYLSVQLVRYWRLVRSVDRIPIYYNAATLQAAPPEVLRLFGVRWLILPREEPVPVAAGQVASEGRFVVYELSEVDPRASVVFDWERLPPSQALHRVLSAGFDPARTAVVEASPQIAGLPVPTTPGGVGSATYQELSPQHVRIQVTTGAPGLLVVRNAFDRDWHAVVDGKPVKLLVADYLMQAVPVPAGSHVVELRYRDPWIAVGLVISAIAWGLLGAFIVLMRRRERRLRAAGISSGHDPAGLGSVGVAVTGPEARSS